MALKEQNGPVVVTVSSPVSELNLTELISLRRISIKLAGATCQTTSERRRLSRAS